MASIQTGIELNDQFTAVIYNIIRAVNLTVSTMEDMQQTMNTDMDTSGIEGVRDEINQATMAMNELNAAMLNQPVINNDTQVAPRIPDPVIEPSTPEMPRPPPEPVEIPVIWNTDGLDVFTGSGVERFQQEVQSANNMLGVLNQTQEQIEQTANTMDILPDSAIQDINAVGRRIQEVQAKIGQIENNPLNIGTDTANAELEQLRSQLNQAVQEQNELNTAMQNMDISAMNDAYLRLSQTVANTERYIRNNVDEQGRFNREIREGTQQADTLMNTIKRAAAAYVSIQAVDNVLNISDELVQTTSRLNMMNDGLQTTEELVNMVYAAAQDSRGSFSDMASVVARFGNNAGDAFSSTAEVVAFANLVQKQMTIAGASSTEASNAMLQLSQALGSGVLRGDELNSIFEQAPNLIQNIADYLDVPIGQIREMASEGELTVDIVKAAIFSASDEINAKFEEMPMTWGQIWQSMQNVALIAFQPVLKRLNELASSESFQKFVNGAIQALATLANIALNVFDLLTAGASFVSDNWSIISPIIYGVVAALSAYAGYLAVVKTAELLGAAAKIAICVASYAHAAATGAEVSATAAQTAAQYGLNTALLSCPLTWIILLIIALIALIFAVCNAVAKLTGVADSGFGIIAGCVNVVIEFFKNLGLTVANIALGIGNAIAALASNMMTAFHNAICSVQSWFYNLLSTALSVIAGICEALNKLPFVQFDYSGITSAADEYAAKAAEAAGNKQDYKSISDAFNEGFSAFDTYQDGWASNAFNAGASWGDGVADAVGNFNVLDLLGSTHIPNVDEYTSQFSGMLNSLDGISSDTGNISDAMDITEENLKYLRDIAEQEAVNRFTTAEIKVDMSGMNNNINNGMDLDGVVSGLTDAVDEAIEAMTEGVHD